MKHTFFLFLFCSLMACNNSKENKTTEKVDDTEKLEKIDKTETAKAFVQAVVNQDVDKVRELAHVDYIQHNPFLPTGLEPFIELFPVLKENGTKATTIRTIEDGNYVVMHNLWTGATPFGADEMVSFDILRFDENGKIAEHWDALTPKVEKTASGRSQTDGPTRIEDLDKTEENKKLAQMLVEDILMGKNPTKIAEYISADEYHQHNPDIKDGLDGIVEAVETFTAQDKMFAYKKIHKVLGEGNFVLTVSEGEWMDKKHVFYDLFRIKNNMVVEHWDVIQEVPTEGLANENTMFNFE